MEKLDSIIDKMIEDDLQQDEIEKEIYDKEENLTGLDKISFKEIVGNYKKSKNKKQLKKKSEKAKKELKKDTQMKQVSLTDPDCRMMQNKKGVSELSYNAQFTVDSKNQIIVANDVCQARNDSNQLQPQIRQVKENIGINEYTKVAVDCAYNNSENLKFFEDEKLDGYAPNVTQTQKWSGREQTVKQDDYEYDWKTDEIIVLGRIFKYFSTRKFRDGKVKVYKDENGKEKVIPEFFKSRLRMKKKMESEEGKQIYNQRKFIVEPVIGNVKENLGLREFRLRGLEGTKLELNLVSIAHNLKKIWIIRGKMNKNNRVSIFYLILINNKMECRTACAF